jgi:hypothetical protein
MANRFFEDAARLAPLYFCLVDETKQIFPKFETDPWHSVGFFLHGYSFEHQGRAPDYRHAAADAILEHCNSKITAKSAETVWNSFRQKLQSNLNCARNPLCRRGWRYRYGRQSRQTSVNKLSVVELVCQNLAGEPLVSWARAQLASGDIQASHSALRKINGVGPKIASFFLRDIATIYAITVADSQKRLLQPIDIWLRFVARKLQQDGKLTDAQCAEFIVKNATAPEKTNQGVWYFCTRAAGSSRYVVAQAIDNAGYFRDTVNLHLHRLCKSSNAAARLMGCDFD